MADDNEIRAADVALQALSASDPAAQASMMRHIVALRLMVTGHLRDADVARVAFGACFGVTVDAEAHFAKLTGIDGVDRVIVAFDVDDPSGPPSGFGLFHIEDGAVSFYDRCRPWATPDGGRAMLVAANDQEVARFSNQPGRALRRTAGGPPGDPTPGYRRAQARLARLVASANVRDAVDEVHVFGVGDRR